MQKYNRLNTETNDIRTMNRKKQNSCNTVFPRDRVCLRNMNINTLHKGDDDDNDNNNNNYYYYYYYSGLRNIRSSKVHTLHDLTSHNRKLSPS